MNDETDDMLAAQQHSTRHRDEIEASERCGCFSCCKTFRPSAVISWGRDGPTRGDDTARCPECGMDSVIGSASGLPITTPFLTRVRRHWFRR